MKKIGIVLLALIMAVGLIGCIDKTENVETGATQAVLNVGEDGETLTGENASETKEMSQNDATVTTKEKPTTTKRPTITEEPTTTTKKVTTTKRPTATTREEVVITTPVVEEVEQMVWIPQSGSKYHSHSSCSNMKNPSHVSLSYAQGHGYTPCKKCY